MVAAVPGEELLMRTISFTFGCKKLPGRIDDPFDAFSIIHLTMNYDIQVVRNANQPSIKHPMCSARERQAVSYRVWTAMLDRMNMGGLGL